ncbi:MAG: hypothetical protein AB4040_12445 [Synechococcus sp.]
MAQLLLTERSLANSRAASNVESHFPPDLQVEAGLNPSRTAIEDLSTVFTATPC